MRMLSCLLLWAVGLPAEKSTEHHSRFERSEAALLQPDTSFRRLVVSVINSSGEPVSDAELIIEPLARRARTDSTGRAIIERLAPGNYWVSARKLGFLPASRLVHAPAESSEVTLALETLRSRLTPVLTTAARGGLTGFVSDTALRPLPGATIRSIDGKGSTRTDANGAFYIKLKSGSYLIEITRDSFARELIGVTIPPDSGRELAVWLSPSSGASNPVEAARLFEQGMRMRRASPVAVKFVSRDGLVAQGVSDMAALARRWANGSIRADCTVTTIQSGVAFPVPLSSVRTEDVEFVEISTPSIAFKVTPRGQTSINGPGRRIFTPIEGYASGGSPACGNVGLTIWLRR